MMWSIASERGANSVHRDALATALSVIAIGDQIREGSTTGRLPMSAFRVTFFKDLMSSQGHLHRCPQFVVTVARAKTAERALAAAQRRFERHSRIKNWRLHADFAEVKPVDIPKTATATSQA